MVCSLEIVLVHIVDLEVAHVRLWDGLEEIGYRVELALLELFKDLLRKENVFLDFFALFYLEVCHTNLEILVKAVFGVTRQFAAYHVRYGVLHVYVSLVYCWRSWSSGSSSG